MIKIILIRHGKTNGNMLKKYVGLTDEPICEEGKQELLNFVKDQRYPKADVVYASPLIRCLQSAEILYHGQTPFVVENLKECNFGLFENKCYDELKDMVAYQNFLASWGETGFPKGETKQEFSSRCQKSFEEIVKSNTQKDITIAFVVHGGTIMAVLERFDQEQKKFYEYQAKNGGGYLLHLEEKLWEEKKLLCVDGCI